MHIHHGADMEAIVVIDYVFHLPLYVTPVVVVVVVWAVLGLVRDTRASDDPAAKRAAR